MDLLVRNARVVTAPSSLAGTSPQWLRGPELGRLHILEAHDVAIRGDRIAAIGPELEAGPNTRILDARDRVLLPGFVDAHTHACWAGTRLDEWEQKLKGATYQELLAAGGGIMATVRAVREASEDELLDALLDRLDWALAEGTTTMEVKSGYGLHPDHELKMLRAIHRAGHTWPGRVVATACIGHALDPDVPDFPRVVTEKHLPRITEAFPGVTIDAYCEEGAWSVAQTTSLLVAAIAAGHPVRVHADQFTSLGMLREAIRLGARSVDHLEATPPAELERLAASDTAGVMLPVSGFHLDDRWADGRRFVDAGGALVVATNWNPGSAPSPSIPLAMALAVRKLGLTPHEALAAVTANAACLLGLDDAGRIAPGARADLVLLRHTDERELAHTVGGSPVAAVICGGQLREG
ncbi:MAG: imidazolonepropionase [Gemmatimonadales bacterium]|nr:MAG: imidazolonepropionase [Gemmatimonadales bacterium]